jgi:cation transport protein ChaC
MRELYQAAVGGVGRALNDEQLSESLTSTLAAKPKGAGWWVFAYGSLLWNPLFPFVEARPAMLRGLHRRFCLYSMASRGTRETPGLVLALDRGGACTGVVYRLPAPGGDRRAAPVVAARDGRGLVSPKWVGVHAGDRELVALAFTVRHDHPQYTGKLPIEEQARVIANAPARSGRRSITSSALAWRSSRTASSIPISRRWPRACPHCVAPRGAFSPI